MKIFPLSEGSFTIDHTKLFVPFDDEADNLQARPTGSLLVEVQPFVVITSTDILLLDTGLGFADKDGRMQLYNNLATAGLQPSDITKVLMTHLHKDHAGGVSNDAHRDRLSFENATYYIQQQELDYAFSKGLPSFIPDELIALKNAKNVVLLQKNKGTIGDQVEYEITGAHSPFHQVFWIKDNNETIFFGGDDAPQLQQMKHRYVAKYDHDGKKAMELRQGWWKKGQKKNGNSYFIMIYARRFLLSNDV